MHTFICKDVFLVGREERERIQHLDGKYGDLAHTC